MGRRINRREKSTEPPDGRFRVVATARSGNPPARLWFLRVGLEWTRDAAAALRFEMLDIAARVGRVMVTDSNRPRDEDGELLPLIVVEDFGEPGEQAHEIR